MPRKQRTIRKIREEIVKVNTRLDEVEGRIEKAEERIKNTGDVITTMLKLHTKLDVWATMVSFVDNLFREGLELTQDCPTCRLKGLTGRWHEDGPKTYETVEEASEDLLRRGYTVTTTTPLETLLEQVQQLTWKRVDRQAKKGTTEQEQNYKKV